MIEKKIRKVYPMQGKKHTENAKMKISMANKGRIVSDETKQKMRLAKLGKSKSPETKRKMSITHKKLMEKQIIEEKKQHEQY